MVVGGSELKGLKCSLIMHNYKIDDVMSLGNVIWQYNTEISCDETEWNVQELILVSGDRGQVFGRECI